MFFTITRPFSSIARGISHLTIKISWHSLGRSPEHHQNSMTSTICAQLLVRRNSHDSIRKASNSAFVTRVLLSSQLGRPPLYLEKLIGPDHDQDKHSDRHHGSDNLQDL